MEIRNYFLMLLAIILILPGCTESQKEKREIIRNVKIGQVTKGDSLKQKSYTGIIKEAGEINLAFRVAGPILKVNVKEGDYVKEGDLIAEIDPRDYEVQLQVAQAQFNQVMSEAGRVARLYDRKSIASNDFEKAQAGEKMVSAKLKNANDQLNDTKLFAPFSGYIQSLNYEEGELINTGMPIASLINLKHYRVEVEIPASLFMKKDSFVSFSCNQHLISDIYYPLQLIGFNKKANNNQLFKLHFKLNPSVNKNLSPGMEVKVNLVYKTGADASVYIPLNAVFEKDGNSFVWVLNSDKSSVKSRQVIVEGLVGNSSVRISSGLKESETIVIAGVNMLSENQKVSPVKQISKTNVGGLL